MDETGWRLRGAQRALWGAFTARHAVLRIEPDRHEDRAKSLLADTTAIVTSDRWWAYSHLPVRRRQICWSHLQRDFAFHAEGRGVEQELGEAGLRICSELFWAWEIFEHTGERAELRRRVRALQRELKPILREHAGTKARYRQGRRFARNLLKIWPALWTFAKHPGVEPTTTTPNAPSADRSSTASSASAASPKTASGASPGCCLLIPPAACSAEACTPTSSTCSAPTPAATPSRSSPDNARAGALNAYTLGLSRPD